MHLLEKVVEKCWKGAHQNGNSVLMKNGGLQRVTKLMNEHIHH